MSEGEKFNGFDPNDLVPVGQQMSELVDKGLVVKPSVQVTIFLQHFSPVHHIRVLKH
jgi:hypothetical protein